MTIRVVIAEDEAIIRMDLRETLEEEGYEVVGETGNGDEAIDLVRDLLPDLAILDVKMPGKDGLEVARLINDEKLCGVLILTAFSQREIIEDARDAGALAYLVKPFQKADLVPAIEVAIGRFRRAACPHRRDRRPRRAARGPQGDRAGQGHPDGRDRPERAGRLRLHPAAGDERALEDARRRRAASSTAPSGRNGRIERRP